MTRIDSAAADIADARSCVEMARDTIKEIADGLAEETCREEEYQAACDQFRKSQAESIRNQLQASLEMVAELMGVSFEEAGRRMAERMKCTRLNPS